MAALPPDEVAFTARIQDLGLTVLHAARFNVQGIKVISDLTLIREELLNVCRGHDEADGSQDIDD
jgi:hypothetical protein